MSISLDSAYQPEDTSIIVPTVDTENTFAECVRLLLVNCPKEIIIVTVPWNLNRVRDFLKALTREEGYEKLKVLTVKHANKREQLVYGIKASSGKILALVDDDIFWPQPTVLSSLLAPFQDPTVGESTGIQR